MLLTLEYPEYCGVMLIIYYSNRLCDEQISTYARFPVVDR